MSKSVLWKIMTIGCPGTLVLTGCLGFEEKRSNKSELAACWAQAKNVTEMRACEKEAEKNSKSPVITEQINESVIAKRADYSRNEAVQRNNTSSLRGR